MGRLGAFDRLFRRTLSSDRATRRNTSSAVVSLTFLFVVATVVTPLVVEAWIPSLSSPPQTSKQFSRCCSPAKSTALHAIRFNATALSIPVVASFDTTTAAAIDHDSQTYSNNNKKKNTVLHSSTASLTVETAATTQSSSYWNDPITAVETPVATTDAVHHNQIAQARLLLLGAAALYGTNFSLIKLQDTFPPAVSTCLRFALAAAATSPWLFVSTTPTTENHNMSPSLLSDQQQQQDQFGAIVAGFEVGLWNSVGYVAQAIGLPTTLASHSAFLCSMAVVIVPILDFVSRNKPRLLPQQVTGVVLAVLGVAFLELDGASFDFSVGEMVSAIQPFAFGMGFWRMEAAMRKYPNQANRSTAAQLLAVFLGSVVYCAIAEPHTDWMQIPAIIAQQEHSATIVASLLWTGVVTTALSIYMETVALKTLSAAETTLIMSSEPVWGSVFAAVLLGEQFGVDAYLGGVLILLGCLISNLGVSGLSKALLRLTPATAATRATGTAGIADTHRHKQG